MKLKNHNYFRLLVVSESFVVLITTWGCEIMDMDKPTAPAILMWRKRELTLKEVNSELNDCGKRADKIGDVSLKKKIEASDICMLKKGFVFVPKPSQSYANFCSGRVSYDMPSCKSWRGEYQVQEDSGGENRLW